MKRENILSAKKFREFFSFFESEFWTATSRRRRVNNQISCHLAFDRNGVLSSNRCSVLREFLARKLVVYHVASSFFIIIINTSHAPHAPNCLLLIAIPLAGLFAPSLRNNNVQGVP